MNLIYKPKSKNKTNLIEFDRQIQNYQTNDDDDDEQKGNIYT